MLGLDDPWGALGYTSAIVGFGGAAGRIGMSALWLVFLSIFVGIFAAFVVPNGRVRRIGQGLAASSQATTRLTSATTWPVSCGVRSS